MRQIGADPRALPVTIGEQGEVMVEDHPIGRLDGFRFVVAPDARATDKRLLLAAAERRLGDERARRGVALAEAEDRDLALSAEVGAVPTLLWRDLAVATLAPGPTVMRPRVLLDRALECLSVEARGKIEARLKLWLGGQLKRSVPGLVVLDGVQRDPAASPASRAVAAALVAHGGIVARADIAVAVEGLDPIARKAFRGAGFTIGALDLFDPRLLKPGAARWRRVLLAARGTLPVGAGPRDGATVLDRGTPGATLAHGYRPVGAQAVRIDLIERIARAAHDARASQGRKPFVLDPALALSMGLTRATLEQLMGGFGFRPAPSPSASDDDTLRWTWRAAGALRAAAARYGDGGGDGGRVRRAGPGGVAFGRFRAGDAARPLLVVRADRQDAWARARHGGGRARPDRRARGRQARRLGPHRQRHRLRHALGARPRAARHAVARAPRATRRGPRLL